MAEHNCACDYLGIANNNSMSSSSSNNSNSSNCSLVNTHTRVKQIKLRQTERQKCKCHNKNNKETASAYIYGCVCAYMQKLFFKSNKKQAAIDKDCNNKATRHKNNAQWNQTRWLQVATRRKTINMHITNSKLCCVLIDWLSISAALINTDMSESASKCVPVLENCGVFGHTVREMPLPGTNQSNKFQKCHIAHMKNVLVTAPNANRRQPASVAACYPLCAREREGESVCVCVSECALLLAWLGKVMSKYAGACCLFYNKAKPSTKKYTHTRNLLLNIQLHTHTQTLPLTYSHTLTLAHIFIHIHIELHMSISNMAARCFLLICM